MDPLHFFGHQVYPRGLFVDVFLAFVPLFWLFLLFWVLKRNIRWLPVLLGYVWILYFPNSVYLILEYRHVILADGIADAKEPLAIIVFGSLAFLGLILTLFQIFLIVNKVSFMSKDKYMFATILSFMGAWGSVLGLNELKTIDGLINPPAVVLLSINLVSTKWFDVGIAIGLVLTALSLLTLKLFKPKRI